MENVEFLTQNENIYSSSVKQNIVIEGPNIEMGNKNASGKILVPLNFELNIRWNSKNEV